MCLNDALLDEEGASLVPLDAQHRDRRSATATTFQAQPRRVQLSAVWPPYTISAWPVTSFPSAGSLAPAIHGRLSTLVSTLRRRGSLTSMARL
jgi:hypothetical protein